MKKNWRIIDSFPILILAALLCGLHRLPNRDELAGSGQHLRMSLTCPIQPTSMPSS